MGDVIDLEVGEAALLGVLVTVVEEAMVVVNQDMETKVVDTVVEEEDMVDIMMSEEILVEVAMVVRSTMVSKIMLGNSNQNMDP